MKEFYPEGMLIENPENRRCLSSVQALQAAMLENKILEARATMCDLEHNLIVDLGVMKGIIPRSEGALGLDSGEIRDIAVISRVNKPVCFVVTDIKTDKDNRFYALLSRKTVQQKCMEQYISKLIPGDIITSRVTHLESFGAFTDIGCGIASLLPIDSISVSRISHPGDRFSTGTVIKAVVKSIDENLRICLTHKELLGTWEENAGMFSQGETVSGIVRSIESYGIFVELTPNLAGLAEYRDNVKIGQQASVYIKSLIPEKMKIKLIIVDAFDAEYAEAEPGYFINGTHIDRFRYSPQICGKVIESLF